MNEFTFKMRIPEEDMSDVMDRKLDNIKLVQQYDELETKPLVTLGDKQSMFFMPTVTTASMTGAISLVETAFKVGYMKGYTDGKEAASTSQDPDGNEIK